jgi:ribosomal-protein-alanine N-acetyltransferase
MNIKTRKATFSDRLSIEALYQTSDRFCPITCTWQNFLDTELFLVVEDAERVRGALLACLDESPIAWTRLGVLDNDFNVTTWFDSTLPLLRERLRNRGAESLLWLDYREWAFPILIQRGFQRFTEVVTLSIATKTVLDTPNTPIVLRPAKIRDTDAISHVDHRAFTPPWRYSINTIRQRIEETTRFIVAVRDEIIVGYIEYDASRSGAHINRVVVNPDCQCQGIGTLLLHDALNALRHCPPNSITINTQIDNTPARRLYQRFGFTPTGESVTIWEYVF